MSAASPPARAQWPTLAATVDVHDDREQLADPDGCPYGLAHRRKDAGCWAFRRAAQAKPYRPPRNGWPCDKAPVR